MENTPENKAKFFAQYWGQNVLKVSRIENTIQHFSTARVGSDTNWNSWVKKGHLELKPLSQISDEEAIQIAKIIDQDEQYRYSIQSRGFQNRHRDILPVLTEWYCPHPLVTKWIKASLIEIDTEDSDIIVSRYANDGKELEESTPDNILHAYDFLRAKGYALPWMGISVTDLVELGWIKLKEENHV